jgi:hypothetical protein
MTKAKASRAEIGAEWPAPRPPLASEKIALACGYVARSEGLEPPTFLWVPVVDCRCLAECSSPSGPVGCLPVTCADAAALCYCTSWMAVCGGTL